MNGAIVLACAMASFGLDQWTKSAAITSGRATLNRRGGMVRIQPIAAAGLFSALAATVVTLLLSVPALPATAAAGLGLAAGGGAGNLLDRFQRGGVIDFIRVGRWPAFNIADAALTVAVPLCLESLFR